MKKKIQKSNSSENQPYSTKPNPNTLPSMKTVNENKRKEETYKSVIMNLNNIF